MVTSLKMRINFGSRQFIVDCNSLTYEKAIDLGQRVSEIRMKNSLLKRYPMEEGEDRTKWLERIEPETAKERQRRPGESTEDHLKRLFTSRMETFDAAHEIINAIAEIFGLPPVAQDDVKNCSWILLKAFIYDVLNLSDIDADEFFPKKPL